MKKISLFILFTLLSLPAIAAPLGNPITSVQSAVAESSHVLKASSGYLNGFSVTSGAVAGYLLIYDATAAPSNGTVTPKFCYNLPATSTIGATWESYPTPFTNGIVLAFSSTGCFTQTLSTTAFFSGQVQ